LIDTKATIGGSIRDGSERARAKRPGNFSSGRAADTLGT
jgi:hypothetical protein